MSGSQLSKNGMPVSLVRLQAELCIHNEHMMIHRYVNSTQMIREVGGGG